VDMPALTAWYDILGVRSKTRLDKGAFVVIVRNFQFLMINLQKSYFRPSESVQNNYAIFLSCAQKIFATIAELEKHYSWAVLLPSDETALITLDFYLLPVCTYWYRTLISCIARHRSSLRGRQLQRRSPWHQTHRPDEPFSCASLEWLRTTRTMSSSSRSWGSYPWSK
jgi:hypothetical protein